MKMLDHLMISIYLSIYLSFNKLIYSEEE